jgi:parvulin-like peptidyl-prolyl isomerase
MAKAPRSKHISRKQQSRVARENFQRRMVLITTILVAALVILVIGYGILDQLVLKNMKPVAKVEGAKITMQEFQTRVRYDRYQYIQNAAMLEQYKQVFSFDQSSYNYYDTVIQQYATLLNDPDTLGSQVIEELINDRVIAFQAEKMGISVSDEEVDKAIQEAFGFYKDGTPTPAPTTIILPTGTYSPKQMTLVPPTSTPMDTATPTSGPTATPAATPTATQPLPTATAGPTSTPYPTETPYTEEGFKTSFQTYVEGLEAEAQINEAQFRSIFRSRLVYQKLLDEVTKDIATDEPYVWARHILVATEDEAKSVIERLNTGEDFALLASDVSTDTSNNMNGGNLGWFAKGKMVTEFENVVFAMTEIGQISEPVQTTYGYHIIQLLGREDRPMTDDKLQQAKENAFTEWLSGVKEEMNIETYENWKGNVPTIPTTPAQYQS